MCGLHGGQLQPLVDGVKDEFQPVRNPHLVVDGAKMVLYGLLGDGEVRANLPVMPALHQATDDALLPAGQRIDRARWVIRVLLRRLRHRGNLPLGEPVFTSVNAAGALDEEFRVHRLENHPRCATVDIAQQRIIGRGGGSDNAPASRKCVGHYGNQLALALVEEFFLDVFRVMTEPD
jgi:hypothetical protein